MKLTIKENEDVTIVTVLESRLDASTAPEFKSEIDTIIKQGTQTMILDISSISFMDSSSLGSMVAILKSLGNSGKLVICGATGVVLELFKLTRMDQVFNLASDLNEAKKELEPAI